MKNNTLIFNQVKQQNFYTAHTNNGGVILKSYNTIAGYIAPDGTLYRVRYTHTTGKQISQYYTTQNQKYLDADVLASIIYTYENILLNCNYNEADKNNLFV